MEDSGHMPLAVPSAEHPPAWEQIPSQIHGWKECSPAGGVTVTLDDTTDRTFENRNPFWLVLLYPLNITHVWTDQAIEDRSPLWSYGGLACSPITKVKQRWAQLVGGWVTASKQLDLPSRLPSTAVRMNHERLLQHCVYCAISSMTSRGQIWHILNTASSFSGTLFWPNFQ
jgi:hypothetical protein